MPTATNNRSNEDQAQQRAERAYGEDRERRQDAREQVHESLETSEQAVSQLVRGWSEAFRSFVPAAWFRPGEAMDVVYDYWQQLIAIQRRLSQELLGVTQDNLRYAQRRSGMEDEQGQRPRGRDRDRDEERQAA